LAVRHPKEPIMAQQISDLPGFDDGDLPDTASVVPGRVSFLDRPQRLPNALPGLTVVLPCFNEADNVADAIRGATAAAERCALTHQIVVVDDGSSDETATIAGALAARDSRVHVVVHARNQGYGDAVRSGIAAATQPWVLLTDADLQFDLDELEGFLPLADGADVVMGWRIARRDPLNRRVNAAAWNWLVRRTFGIPVRDVDCAFKLVRTDLVQGLNLQSTGAMISTELLVRSLRRGARLEQRGVNHLPRVAGDPSGASPRVVARAFRELLTLRRTLRVAGA
jgi:glycosyltransferase involved in cell wall biosynthesis